MPAKAKVRSTPREDFEIARDIQRKLKADAEFPYEAITITVLQGVVTLQGKVSNLLQREAAQALAAKVKGVRFIENHLAVELGPPPFET